MTQGLTNTCGTSLSSSIPRARGAGPQKSGQKGSEPPLDLPVAQDNEGLNSHWTEGIEDWDLNARRVLKVTVDARSILARQSSFLYPISHQLWGLAVLSMPCPCPLPALSPLSPPPPVSGHLMRQVAAPALPSCPPSAGSVFSPQHRPGPAPSPAPPRGTIPGPPGPCPAHRRLRRRSGPAAGWAHLEPAPLLGQRLSLPLAPDQQPAQESAWPGAAGLGLESRAGNSGRD